MITKEQQDRWNGQEIIYIMSEEAGFSMDMEMPAIILAKKGMEKLSIKPLDEQNLLELKLKILLENVDEQATAWVNDPTFCFGTIHHIEINEAMKTEFKDNVFFPCIVAFGNPSCPY